MSNHPPFTPLARRLDSVPVVLCGPMVRRVEPDAVTLWMALRQPAEVRSRIVSLDGATTYMEGTRATVAVGDNLHIVAVTATGAAPLERDRVYGYDIAFDLRAPDGGSERTADSLFAPGIVAADEDAARAALLYAHGPAWPSFAVPPDHAEALRVVHGSCRRVERDGVDALPALDAMIEQGATSGTTRPHLFFLTGDTIYADGSGLSRAFLALVSDAAQTLLGWRELLPGLDRHVDEIALHQRAPFHRPVVGIPEPGLLQLYGLGEFLAMHLLVMSDALWPAEQLPDEPGSGPIAEARAGLPRVRRALANISTYAVFDDHEIADDWNLNLHWTRRVYGRPLGRRVVTNGLAAYALMYGWGNRPDDFAEASDGPGARLLEALASWRPTAAGPADSDGERALMRILSVPADADALTAHGAPPRLWHEPDALPWHFDIKTSGYEIIALDLRSWRAYPGSRLGKPELLSDEALAAQVPEVSSARVPVTIMISSIPFITHHETLVSRAWQYVVNLGAGVKGWFTGSIGVREKIAHGRDEGDIWHRKTRSFQDLLARLVPRERVVVLSGDIHFGYATRVTSEAGGQRAVIAQLVSSGMLNQRPTMRKWHEYGYNQPWPSTRKPKNTRGSFHGGRYVIEYVRADKRGAAGRDVVRKNHIGEVVFARERGTLMVTQRTWWHDNDEQGLAPRSPFTVVLDIE